MRKENKRLNQGPNLLLPRHHLVYFLFLLLDLHRLVLITHRCHLDRVHYHLPVGIVPRLLLTLLSLLPTFPS